MKRTLLLITCLLQLRFLSFSQDTFSILAFDSLTREVGAAGASCVDLFMATGYSNDFICEVFPDTGAIACQASYLPNNQAIARSRMRAGDSPTQIISWLIANDVGGNPSIRQYGAVRFVSGTPRTAAYTGTNCMNYKNNIVGPNYTIHGNILLGQVVLDSMEAGFKRAKGDLACKLMGALQGAKMIGADSRCAPNNSSSLFSFLKVTQPTDTFGRPSFIVSLKTHSGAQIEPIDSLQKLFDAAHTCTVNSAGIVVNQLNGLFSMYPNPALEKVRILAPPGRDMKCRIYDVWGRVVGAFSFQASYTLNVSGLNKGIYFVEISDGAGAKVKKLVID